MGERPPAPLLEVENLEIRFGSVAVVHGISFAVAPGQTVAFVGESGCGKSVTALALMRLLPEPPARLSGAIRVMRESVLDATPERLRAWRGHLISYVFQEPAAALNPVLTVGAQIRECHRLHGRLPARTEMHALLRELDLPPNDAFLARYPHQLSGGMQQRVMLAMALACRPALLIADEPTTALDVEAQRHILELLDRHRANGLALLLITHNLALVAGRADTVHVMYAGAIVESGPADRIVRAPRHPYTQALLRCVPRLTAARGATRLPELPGVVPAPGRAPAGCAFAPRCPRATPIPCETTPPPVVMLDGDNAGATGHCLRCHHPEGV